MNRKPVVRCITSLLLGGACLALGLTVSIALAAPDKARNWYRCINACRQYCFSQVQSDMAFGCPGHINAILLRLGRA